MSSAYNCELAWRTVKLLATLPMEMRERLPAAWDEGMSLIDPDSLPQECIIAREGLQTLRTELRRDTTSSFARTFGAAFASVRRKHNYPTLVRYAELMLDIKADLDRQFELELEGRKV